MNTHTHACIINMYICTTSKKSIALVPEKAQRSSTMQASSTPKIKSAEEALENGFNNDNDVIFDKNNEIINAINSDIKKKKMNKTSPNSKSNKNKTKEVRLRILVGFRGKSFKVWDVVGSSTKGFIEALDGTEVRTEEAVR